MFEKNSTTCLRWVSESSLSKLQSSEKSTDCKKPPFSIKQIKHDDHLISFYTGFKSFEYFWSFTSSLDLPLSSFITGEQNQMLYTKLSLMDQLFLTLVKLRLDLKFVDNTFRFNFSSGLVSSVSFTFKKLFITLISYCFLLIWPHMPP